MLQRSVFFYCGYLVYPKDRIYPMWYKLTILLLLRNPLLLSTPNQTGKYELIPKTIGYHMTVWAAGQSVNTGIQNRTSGNI